MNNKGFTLIELIATIVLLGILASVSFVSITSVLENSKDNNCKSLTKNLASAAKEYASDRRFDSNFTTYASQHASNGIMVVRITAQTLIDTKYINKNNDNNNPNSINNPYDKGNIIRAEEITIDIYLNNNYTVKEVGIVNSELRCLTNERF